LIRTGLIDEQQYFDLVAKTITRVQRGSGRLVQTVTDSSFDAWHKFYKQDANAPNAIVSYYSKGALVSLCLDAEIRKATNNEKSLDDLMKLLWSRWLDTAQGLGEREPEVLASEVAGKDLSEFFDNALYSTEELPIDSALHYLGVDVHWRMRKSASDAGGGSHEGDDTANSVETAKQTPWLGANVDGGAGKVNVTHVFAGGAAQLAGLAPGDTIIAIDNLIVSAAGIADLLKRHATTESLSLHYSRHGVLRTTQLPLMEPVPDTCSLSRDDSKPVLWPSNAPA